MNKTVMWVIGGVLGLGLIFALAFSIANEPVIDPSIAFGDVTVEGANLPYVQDPAVADPGLGLAAPKLTGADWTGKESSIGPDGRAKIVVFLAHWCPHCQNEVPVIQNWVDTGGLPDGVDMYSVTVLNDHLRPNWPPQDWLEEEGWTIPTIMDDEAGSAVQAFGMVGTPFYVVLDGNNNNIGRFSGEVGVGGLQTMALLAERSIGS